MSAMEAVAIQYRKPGAADIGEASWMGLANLIMSGELPAETEVFTHEDATVAEAGASLCSVANLIDISEAAEADADDADEIAATLQESFAALAAPPEPEPEPAHSMPSPIESLSDVQRACLEEAKKQLGGVEDLDVLAYLKTRNFSVPKAVAQCQATQQWRRDRGPITIADVARFMRTPAGQAGPDGCMMVLEDGRGDCARDNWGRPVIVTIGMLHGTAEEQQTQMIYATERAAALTRPGAPPGVTNVIEVVPKDGAAATFRFPDADVRTCFDLQKAHFPRSLSSTNHFVGVPRAVTWGFKLCKPFMDREAYNNMKLWQNADKLPEFIPASSRLPHWGAAGEANAGTWQFDLDAYIAQRAKAEGVTVDMNDIARFGTGLSADTQDEDAGTSANNDDAINASLTVSLDELLASGDVCHSGSLFKRGGGGAFGNTKWKEKFGVLVEGALFVFDSDEVSTTNMATRLVPLTGSGAAAGNNCSLELLGKKEAAREHGWCVSTAGRDYQFAALSKEAQLTWVSAIEAQIQQAAAAMVAPAEQQIVVGLARKAV